MLPLRPLLPGGLPFGGGGLGRSWLLPLGERRDLGFRSLALADEGGSLGGPGAGAGGFLGAMFLALADDCSFGAGGGGGFFF